MVRQRKDKKMTEDLKMKVHQAMHNGTFMKALIEESLSPLAKLQRSKPADNSSQSVDAQIGVEFSGLLSGKLVSGNRIPRKSTLSESSLSRAVLAATNANVGDISINHEVVSLPERGFQCTDGVELARLERKMHELVAERRKEQEEVELFEKLQMQQMQLQERSGLQLEETEEEDTEVRLTYLDLHSHHQQHHQWSQQQDDIEHQVQYTSNSSSGVVPEGPCSSV